MPKRLILLLILFGSCLDPRAAILPPEKLLPKDTVLLVTVPDFVVARGILTNSPLGRLWQDPALRPFKDKFTDKFTTNLITPLERNLGVQLSSYPALAQGQMTFALLPMSRPDKPENHFAQIFLLDTKGKAAQLRANLADIRQKWAAAGKPMKTRTIREIDFTTFIISSDDLSWDKIMAKPKSPLAADEIAAPPSTNKVEVTFGQDESLLLVSDSTEAIEKVLSRQAGGLLPALEEEPSFQADFAARLRGAPFYAWINVKNSIDILTKVPATDGDDANATRPDSSLAALGLTGLTSASLSYRSSPEGIAMQFFIGAPEAKRRGLLKALAFEPKDANPPAFVPADATKFLRWRLNIPHTWNQLETMLNEFNPQYNSLLNFVLQSAGKDKDEKYDLKSELLGNLGDDIIHYEKAAQAGGAPSDLNSTRDLYLIGSPKAEKLAVALKTGLSFAGTAKDREFLGRQICTLTMPSQGAAPARSFSFSGSGGYVALSDDSGMIEEYLRSNDNKSKPLSDTPGLAEAAQKVSGMGTGLFSFENHSLGMRALLETLRLQPVTLQDLLGATSVPGINTGDQVAKLREWADFSLLPPYDTISQYFYFSVFSGAFSPEGFTLNSFTPTPPKLR